MVTYRSEQDQDRLEELLRRDHSLNGGILFGLDGYVIEVQARAVEVLKEPASWRAATTISGMTRGAVWEALDRLSGAFAKLGIPQPEVEILVNLAPADLPKEGTWLDLPIAVILLQAAGYLPDLPEHKEGDFVLMGEIGIHGEVRRIPGALSLAFQAKPGQALIVPTGNEKECALILAKPGHEGCRVCPVSTLEEVIEFFKGKRTLENALKQGIQFESFVPKGPDFGVIKGQVSAKEGAYIAAAGGHNLLLVGPPGEGKSLIASPLPGIMPRLTDEEKVQLTRIYSACGALDRDGVAVTRRPVRSIHHTASKQAIIGGGSKIPQPGEVTMSHLGVLFLDEIAEFSSSTLEALRQPLENGEVVLVQPDLEEHSCRVSRYRMSDSRSAGLHCTDGRRHDYGFLFPVPMQQGQGNGQALAQVQGCIIGCLPGGLGPEVEGVAAAAGLIVPTYRPPWTV